MATERVNVKRDENDILEFFRNNLKPRVRRRAKNRFPKDQHIVLNADLRSPERHPIIIIDVSKRST